MPAVSEVFPCFQNMSGPTEIVGTCRRAVITGLSMKPEWSELSDKLTFLKYARITDKETQEEKYVVYAHSPLALRQAAWKKLFAGAEAVEKLSEFEDCERYCRLKRKGLLKSLGDPLRKDVVREKTRENTLEKNEKQSKKRKASAVKQTSLEKKSKFCDDDKAKYTETLAWVKDWPEDFKFDYAALMTKLGEKSVDWRRARDYHSKTRVDWDELRRSGIDQVLMMVDDINEEPNHQIVARAREKMTLREWNTAFAGVRMIVQAVLEPVDLTVRTPAQKADGEQFYLLSHE